MKLDQLLKDKWTKIIVVSGVGNLALLFFVTGFFDLITSLLYLGLAILIGKLLHNNKLKLSLRNVFIATATLTLGYNISGMILVLFTVSDMMIVIGAIQQGVVGLIVARVMGVKK